MNQESETEMSKKERQSHQSKWNMRYEQVKAYKEAFGDFNIKNEYPEADALETWMKTQRRVYKSGKITTERINLLNQIGFDWDPHETRWQEMYGKLVAYYEEHGHCNIPQARNSNVLSVWVGRQRGSYKANKLSKERVDLLNAIGFEWRVKQL